ncbi:unnamed protein product [Closterium sp. NIES-54]
MGHFIPTNATATAEATARLFFDRIITIHGIPATLISDRDPKFTSKFWKELMGLLGTKLAMSFAYHPQTDGQTERLNQVVEQLLRTTCKDDVSHWDTQLPTLEFAYNNASHAATGKTPFFLCYGRKPLTPQQPTTPAHVQAVHDFVTTMQQLWEKTQRRLTTMQTSQKQYADRQRRDHSVVVGDQVLLDTRNLNLSHLPSKLRPRFCGPFLVEAQVTPVTLRLRLPDTWKLHNAFHVQLLKPHKDPNQQSSHAGTGGVEGDEAGDPTEPGAAGAADPGAGGARDIVRPRPYFLPLIQQVLGVPSSTSLTPPLLCPPPDQSQLPLQPASPLPASSPYIERYGGPIKRRAPASRRVSPFCTACRIPRSRPPPVPGTDAMALRPSSHPLRVPLPAPPESSLPHVPDPESDRARAASPIVAGILATTITDPSFESAAAFALVAELLDFAAASRPDYATPLVALSESASPLSIGGECTLGTDVLKETQKDFECLAAAIPRFASMLLAPEGDPDDPDNPTPRSYAEAITGPYSSQWQEAMDAQMASWKSTGTYVDDVPPPGANIVVGMWILWVKRPPGSPPAFKARYVARGFSQRQGWSLWRPVYGLSQAPREWHDTLRTTLAALGFAPSTADPSLFLRTDTSLPPFYVLVYIEDLVFTSADTEALTLLKSEPQKRHTSTDLGEVHSYLGLQITGDRARRTITLTQSHMVHQVLQRFGFQFSSPQPTPLSTSHSLSAPPFDESVEPSGPFPELVGCLMYLMTCTRPDLAYLLSLLARYVTPGRHQKVHWDAAKRVLRYLCSTLGMGLVLGGRGLVVLTSHADASWADDSATQRSSQGYNFSLGSSSVSGRSTYSSSVLSSSCEVEIYAGAMAAQ